MNAWRFMEQHPMAANLTVYGLGNLLAAALAAIPGGETALLSDDQQTHVNAAAKSGAQSAMDTLVRLADDPQCTRSQGSGPNFTDCRAYLTEYVEYDRTDVQETPTETNPNAQTETQRRIYAQRTYETPGSFEIHADAARVVYPDGGRIPEANPPENGQKVDTSYVRMIFDNPDPLAHELDELQGPAGVMAYLNDPATEVVRVSTYSTSALGRDAKSTIEGNVLGVELSDLDLQSGAHLSDQDKRGILETQLADIPRQISSPY